MKKKDDSFERGPGDILQCLQVKMPGILAKRPVMLAYAYGSVVEGTASPSSDVDIGLVLGPNSGLSSYERMQLEFDIAAEVEDLCGIREADVRSIDKAPLTVQGMVVSDGRLVYSCDEEFRVEYEVRTRKLYFDFMPVMEMMRKAFFERVKTEGFTGGKTRQS